MTPTPKTIQIFLPGGDPRGIRIAEITTRILQVIEVPRSLLGEFSLMPESSQVALYFLFGETDDTDQRVYNGWLEWKDDTGRTLHELKRQQNES